MQKILMLSVMFTVLCLGAVTNFSNNWGEYPLFNVGDTRSSGVDMIFSMHQLVTEEMMLDGAEMKSFSVPAVFLQRPGRPNLCGASRYLAIPEGARVQVTILNARTEIYSNVEVAPAPTIPRDDDDSPLRYEKDISIYGKNAYWPASPVLVSPRTEIRGVDVVLLGVVPFQYNPVTKELIIYKDIQFRVDFIGGNGQFGEDRLRNRYWEPILQGNLLNYSQLPKIDFSSPERLGNRDNVEYIIIVPDDATFIAWGDTLKRWRILQGISSDVFTLTEIGGSTTTAIENFLNNAYNNWNPAPVGFLILSDYATSGTEAYGVPSPMWNSYCVSDNIYADVNADNLPDMIHGRFAAQTNAQLDTMIHKLLTYEKTPSTSATFYDMPIVAAAWQTERWFQLCGETVRNFFQLGLGKTTNRLYAIYGGTPIVGGPYSSRVGTRAVVQYWHNAGWLPDTLNMHDAAWWNNGNNTLITQGINSGAFIVQHRDHGAETGWGEPAYSNSDIYNLTNLPPNLTFVNSSNCLTGKYNYSGECFAERFHRDTHGAVGLNAASEISYSFVNDTYVWGSYDCMWQFFDQGYPTFNMTGYDNLRPCAAMCYGKIYHHASWMPDSAQAPYELYTDHLFHHHTDVFLTLYSQIPQNLTVSHASSIPAGQTYFDVTANDSSVIALVVNYNIIGVAEGTGSPVTFNFAGQNPNDTIVVTVTKANYYRYSVKVPVIDAGMPAIPTVTKPMDFGRLPALNPTLTFTSTDPDGDQIRYRVMWDTDPTYASPESSTTANYASGVVVNFSFPSNLTNGATYWWKVKCTDPSGSGYWTGYTTSRSFTVDTSLPANTCSWYQTTAAQFGFNTFNGTVIQGDSVLLIASGGIGVETLQVQAFSSASIPTGWTVVNGNGDAYQWVVGTTSDMGSYTPPDYGSYYAYYSDDDAGSGVINNNEELLSPKWYVGGQTGSVVMEYGWGFQLYETGEKYRVKFRKKTGSGAWTAWTDKKVYTGSGSGTDTIALAAELPCDSIQFDWFFSDSTASSHWGYAVAMDNALLRRTYSISNDYGTLTGSGVDYKELSKTYARTKWGWMVWRKAAGGDSIGLQAQYYTGSAWSLVPNGVLPGNSVGFYTQAATDSIDLSALDTNTYRNLRLLASFYRKAKAPTNPALLDWEVGNLHRLIAVAEQTAGGSVVFGLSLMPNPFNGRLQIAYSVGPDAQKAELKIFDAAGRLVKLFNHLSANQHGGIQPVNQVVWDGSDDVGRSVPAGVYFIRLAVGPVGESDGQEVIEKAILLR